MGLYLNRLAMLVFLMVLESSCSRVHTLNLKSHTFGKKGRRIVWFQIAGLSEEHLAFLKFNKKDFNQKIELEKFKCVGKMWSYNYFDLRPTPAQSFMSQMVGSREVVGNCSDLKHEPIWKILKKVQFDIGILEGPGPGSEKYSLSQYLDCPGEKGFFKDIIFWRMKRFPKKGTKGNKNLFHYQNKISFRPGIFYDKSCQSKKCFASLYNNASAFWRTFSKGDNPKLFIIRDFSFYRALKAGNFKKAESVLNEISKTIEFVKSHSKESETALLLTTASSLLFEFPQKGKEWAEFQKSGKNMIFHKSSLLSSIWASGPGSENFCGIYEESEVLKRILWSPERKIFSENFLKNLIKE